MLRVVDQIVGHGVRAQGHGAVLQPDWASIDPELMVRMLLIGYLHGIRSERRLCAEVHLNLAYRWFCRLGLEGSVPDHSTFSKNRHGRFPESDLVCRVFEHVVGECMRAGALLAHPPRASLWNQERRQLTK